MAYNTDTGWTLFDWADVKSFFRNTATELGDHSVCGRSLNGSD